MDKLSDFEQESLLIACESLLRAKRNLTIASLSFKMVSGLDSLVQPCDEILAQMLNVDKALKVFVDNFGGQKDVKR